MGILEFVRRIVGACGDRPQAASAGARAEALAAHHLARSARVLARNVRYRGGEIDLIIDDGRAIAFVEVRLRSSADFGGAASSITPRKKARLRFAAESWLAGAGRRHRHRPCRFDAVLLDGLDEARIVWLQDVLR